MIKEEVFRNAKLVDLFSDLTEEEKEEAEFFAKVEMMLHDKQEADIVSLEQTAAAQLKEVGVYSDASLQPPLIGRQL